MVSTMPSGLTMGRAASAAAATSIALVAIITRSHGPASAGSVVVLRRTLCAPLAPAIRRHRRHMLSPAIDRPNLITGVAQQGRVNTARGAGTNNSDFHFSFPISAQPTSAAILSVYRKKNTSLCEKRFETYCIILSVCLLRPFTAREYRGR